MKPTPIKLLNAEDAEFFLQHLDRHMAESNSEKIFHPHAPNHTYNTLKNRNSMKARWALKTEDPHWEKVWAVWNRGQVIGHVDLKGGPLASTLHRCRLGMGVEGAFRRKGIGTLLVARAILEAKELGLSWIDLQVFSTNTAAIQLYKKMGFKKYGEQSDAFRISGQKIDDLSMTLKL
jgi:RimJ/RimL family protein N-acetyltransferase